MFPPVNELRAKFAEARYIVEEDTIRQVYLGGVMQKPILIEGPPGCGKTELAKAVALALDTKLERLQCYPGIDEEKALGRFDRPCRSFSSRPNPTSSGPDGSPSELACTRWTFLCRDPLMRSLQYEPRQCVPLIDEVDKVDEEFESMLLEILSDWQTSVSKLGTVPHKTIPFVILTSNEVRRIGDPLRRRCAYFRAEFPSVEREAEIMRVRSRVASPELQRVIAGLSEALRGYRMEKPPSIAEMIEFEQALEILQITELAAEQRDLLLPFLAKTREDRKRLTLQDGFASLVRNAKAKAENLKPEAVVS